MNARAIVAAWSCALTSSCVVAHDDAFTVAIGDATLHVALVGEPPVATSLVRDWIERSARAVADYFGRFPVTSVELEVAAAGRGVGRGVTRGSHIHVELGRDVRESDLRRDWVLTHELLHVGFPTLDDDAEWAMEGMAVYVEPIARARAGLFTARELWRGLVDGVLEGRPRRGDRGLDGARSWGRVYWGGALFWLVADVRIREQTRGASSLDDVFRAILSEGGNGLAIWPLARVFSVGAAATGTTVLRDLDRELGREPGWIDENALWRRLGVRPTIDGVEFDDDAPLASIRRAITDSKSNRPTGR